MDGTDRVDLESTASYLRSDSSGPVDLESPGQYMERARADVHRSKAKAANVVAYILVTGLVLSLPLCLLAVGLAGGQIGENTAAVFTKWYDVVAPLLGAVIGAMYGMSIANRRNAAGD